MWRWFVAACAMGQGVWWQLLPRASTLGRLPGTTQAEAIHTGRSSPPQDPGTLGQGGSRGHHVIDEQDTPPLHAPRRTPVLRGEGTPDVGEARAAAGRPLGEGPTHPGQEGLGRDPQASAQLGGQQEGLVMASLEPPGEVQGYRHDELGATGGGEGSREGAHRQGREGHGKVDPPPVLEGQQPLTELPVVGQGHQP